MLILFTDIDGVLNTPSERYPDRWYVSTSRLDALLRLCNTYSARVVICSSWRFENPAGCHRLGLPLHPAWHTPVLGGSSRGMEIAAWLERHAATRYAILDDHDSVLENQRHCFVQPATDIGLAPHDLDNLERVFRGWDIV